MLPLSSRPQLLRCPPPTLVSLPPSAPGPARVGVFQSSARTRWGNACKTPAFQARPLRGAPPRHPEHNPKCLGPPLCFCFFPSPRAHCSPASSAASLYPEQAPLGLPGALRGAWLPLSGAHLLQILQGRLFHSGPCPHDPSEKPLHPPAPSAAGLLFVEPSPPDPPNPAAQDQGFAAPGAESLQPPTAGGK